MLCIICVIIMLIYVHVFMQLCNTSGCLSYLLSCCSLVFCCVLHKVQFSSGCGKPLFRSSPVTFFFFFFFFFFFCRAVFFSFGCLLILSLWFIVLCQMKNSVRFLEPLSQLFCCSFWLHFLSSCFSFVIPCELYFTTVMHWINIYKDPLDSEKHPFPV